MSFISEIAICASVALQYCVITAKPVKTLHSVVSPIILVFILKNIKLRNTDAVILNGGFTCRWGTKKSQFSINRLKYYLETVRDGDIVVMEKY